MTKYILRRLLHGVLSIIVVVAIVMILIYSLLDRDLVFASDPQWSKLASNEKIIYEYRKWEEYGYVDYITYAEYVNMLAERGEINDTDKDASGHTERERVTLWNVTTKIKGIVEDYNDPENAKYTVEEYLDKLVESGKLNGTDRVDGYTERERAENEFMTQEIIEKFKKEYSNYNLEVLDTQRVSETSLIKGGNRQVFAYRDVPLINRLVKYFVNLFKVDNINYVPESDNQTGDARDGLNGERGISFTFFDPVKGGKTFSPAIIGNGTEHKYLLYFDGQFPYIHQNLLTVQLGTSYSVNNGVDVFRTMNESQGTKKYSTVTYADTNLTEQSADNLHSATYVSGSLKSGNKVIVERYTDNYTDVTTNKGGMSKIGYSFVIGILAVLMSYLLGIPLGIIMAKRKDKLVDKLGTFYIVFISAVPSLAYIFLFKAIGRKIGLPTTFDMDSTNVLVYILPIVSLALPSIAGLMKWIRRYMIDQMNSDYVKFARSGGLSEGEIFRKHILKNAIIPVVHGIPGSVLGALTGAIITERVYVVPGAGNLLTEAINKYDNGVIVGVTLFYAVLSVVSIILGDVLMAMVDPRISFSSKAR